MMREKRKNETYITTNSMTTSLYKTQVRVYVRTHSVTIDIHASAHMRAHSAHARRRR